MGAYEREAMLRANIIKKVLLILNYKQKNN